MADKTFNPKSKTQEWESVPWQVEGQGDMAGSLTNEYQKFGEVLPQLMGNAQVPGFNGAMAGIGSGDMAYNGATPELIDYLRQNGYQLKQRFLSGDTAGGLAEVGLYGPDGKLVGQTRQYQVPSAKGDLTAMGTIAAMAATMGALNGAGAAGAGAGATAPGAVGGSGLSVAPGSGLTLGSAGASGTGLVATPGAGLSLAGATGTGTGLAVTPSMAGAIGAGIGSTLPAVGTSMISPGLGGGAGAGATGAGTGGAAGGTGAGGAGGAGGATTGGLPSWLTSNAGRLALTAGLGGAAAAGGGAPDLTSQKGIATTLGQYGSEQAGIARDQYTDALKRISVNDPLFTQIIQSALTQQQQQGQRSDTLWNSYATNFLPAAEKFAQQAMTYDTPGRRAEEEARARAGVEAEATMQRQAQSRALGRAGVGITSGRALTLDNAARLNTTKLSTGAADTARRNVENTGLSLLNTTAGIGQGIVGTSQQQAGQSLAAGTTASNTMGTQVNTRNAALAPTQAFYGGATSATGQAGNVLNQVANNQQQNEASRNAGLAGLGGLAGTLLTAGKDSIIGDWLSDPKSKTVHGKVSGKKALADVESEPVKKFTYKPGLGDGGSHIGRMAGKGDPMGADGMRRISVQDEVGKHAAAIGQVARDVKKLTAEVRTLKRLTLGDATNVREAA